MFDTEDVIITSGVEPVTPTEHIDPAKAKDVDNAIDTFNIYRQGGPNSWF